VRTLVSGALKDKVVLVTGGSRGIGAAIVRAVAEEGGLPILHYGRAGAQAEAVAAGLPKRRCRLIQADLARPEATTELWQEAERWKGRIDVVVNNAAIYLQDGADADDETWNRVWAETLLVNLKAAADLCRLAIRHFRPRGGGIIVNIASRAAYRGDARDFMAYPASKGGMVAMTKTIARGYAAENILAYSVAPGWVRTDMAEDYIKVHGEEGIVRDIPMGDLAPPEDVAAVVVFLASGKAPHTTGATIDINGASYVR
jgi:3-oxoacyl-[acyl-carrier protein] reductase